MSVYKSVIPISRTSKASVNTSLTSLAYWDDSFYRLTFDSCHPSKPYPKLHFSVWKVLKAEIKQNT